MSIFNFGTNLGLTGSKYFVKIIFDIKIEISIFEISNVPNLKLASVIFYPNSISH